jgi:hypothetical protein
LEDAYGDAGHGPTAVSFQVELVFAGVEDRFHDLS